MELWIRSQDKERLLKVEDITMEEINDGFSISGNGHWLGYYFSEEKCIEILDEIQKELLMTTQQEILGHCKINQEEDIATQLKVFREKSDKMTKNLVYEMPADDSIKYDI